MRQKLRSLCSFSITAIVALAFFFFFLLPVWRILRGGIQDGSGHFTLNYLSEVFQNPIYLQGLWNSVKIAFGTTAIAFVLAMPLAWLSDRYDFPGKKIFTGALLLPMILAPFVGALGLQCIFGKMGALNALLEALHLVAPGGGPDWFAGGYVAVVLLEALHLYPILYLNLTSSLANIDPLLLEAAADYGCTGWRRFWKITLPMMMPGIFAGGSLVFIWSFTELGTPLMFNYGRCTAVQIYQGLNDMGNDPMPYALVVVVMVASSLLYLSAKWLLGRNSLAQVTKAGRGAKREVLTGMRALPVFLIFGCVLFLSILPHLGVLGLGFCQNWYHSVLPGAVTLSHFADALGNGLTVPSIVNSLRYAGIATVASLVLGVVAAYRIVRGKGRTGVFLDILVMLPLAVPGLVVAFGYLSLGQKGEIFHYFNPVQNPTVLLIISYAIRRVPYVVRAAVAGLEQTSVHYEEAAASLGAGRVTVFRRITVPLIAANLIAGAILAFSFSMLEVSDSLILAQKENYFPITKAIYALSGLLGEGKHLASALGVWTMCFLGTSLMTASAVLGKKLGALFRV